MDQVIACYKQTHVDYKGRVHIPQDVIEAYNFSSVVSVVLYRSCVVLLGWNDYISVESEFCSRRIIDSKNRVLLPKAMMKKLGISKGDRVYFKAGSESDLDCLGVCIYKI